MVHLEEDEILYSEKEILEIIKSTDAKDFTLIKRKDGKNKFLELNGFSFYTDGVSKIKLLNIDSFRKRERDDNPKRKGYIYLFETKMYLPHKHTVVDVYVKITPVYQIDEETKRKRKILVVSFHDSEEG